jgi:hypothetical protein
MSRSVLRIPHCAASNTDCRILGFIIINAIVRVSDHSEPGQRVQKGDGSCHREMLGEIGYDGMVEVID